MKAIHSVSSPIIYLPFNNIDTDQIIPARFLKTITKDGFGEKLFHDWRYTADGNENPNFVLNQEPGRGSKILFTGENFGCGSSREHAPWAIQSYGIDVVIARSFADIFRNNSQKIGILLIQLPDSAWEQLNEIVKANRELIFCVDLQAKIITTNDFEVDFEIDPYYRSCLLEGLDSFGYLLKQKDAIRQFEANLR